MCGISAFIGNNNTENVSDKRKMFLELSKRIRHRGPDWNGIYMNDSSKIVICHERLSIVGVGNGSQPINIDNKYILSVNGEIYNHSELYDVVLQNKYKPQTESDCEIIVYLYKEFGIHGIKMLDGIFSFLLYDIDNGKIFIGRDPIGIIPLYYGFTDKDEFMCASEMKCLVDNCVTINHFPPGHYLDFNHTDTNSNSNLTNQITKYYNPSWTQITYQNNIENEELYTTIRTSLTNAVNKRLMCDVPFGVLLSGGLDSSLIASITSRLLKTKNHNWGNSLHTFSIGLKDAPDLISAKKVSDFLGTIHHEYTFTVQEGIDCIEDLIYHLETYDVTTIRASTPMFLMSRKIKSLGIKMVLSGEGADEILGGYLYFHNAPSDDEFHNECISRVNNLHNFDCLRANKSTMSWGLEARVPFLDKGFLELMMPINPKLKLKKIEKYILRKSFETKDKYLPEDILWRQKEQFSDGVGYNWIDGLKEFINNTISDDEFITKQTQYQTNNCKDIPKNKEELYYREIFDRLFPGRETIVPRWIPKMNWEGVSYDPSGRAQTVHNETTK
jgi:asparagine synthase (glutamine-hydrolysing)